MSEIAKAPTGWPDFLYPGLSIVPPDFLDPDAEVSPPDFLQPHKPRSALNQGADDGR